MNSEDYKKIADEVRENLYVSMYERFMKESMESAKKGLYVFEFRYSNNMNDVYYIRDLELIKKINLDYDWLFQYSASKPIVVVHPLTKADYKSHENHIDFKEHRIEHRHDSNHSDNHSDHNHPVNHS